MVPSCTPYRFTLTYWPVTCGYHAYYDQCVHHFGAHSPAFLGLYAPVLEQFPRPAHPFPDGYGDFTVYQNACPMPPGDGFGPAFAQLSAQLCAGNLPGQRTFSPHARHT